MIQTLIDYYRIPPDMLVDATSNGNTASGNMGFFRFGRSNICFGRCQCGAASSVEQSEEFDASKDVHRNGRTIQLPFDFAEVIDNLRLERYRQSAIPGKEMVATSEPIRKFYYLIRRCLPVAVRRQIQKAYFRDWKKLPFPRWPVDFTVDNLHEEFLRLLMETKGVTKVPFIWFWPNGAPNCLMMTHDVETLAGRGFTSKLMDLDDRYGIKASFQVIPERRYDIPDEYVREIRERGFEFNVHDLNHDGNLYRERDEFVRRAARINNYVRQYNTRGFRAGAMYRNQDWYDVFEFSYDMSVPNVAHLEPMRGGCCTVMPYFVGKIVELPLTTAQDYSLFHILNDYSIDLWKQQLALLKARHGLMSFITHPDYLVDLRARSVYQALLEQLREMVAHEQVWAALPGDVDRWWRARNEMKLVQRGCDWEIVGPDKDRARIAYANVSDGELTYEIT